MKQYIEKCLGGQDLTVEEAEKALNIIMSGQASDAQVAGLLIALRAKGESTAELVGFARTMRERAIRIMVDDPDAVDIVGTGGDGAGTFNISTVAAFVIAGAGITVAKHGNRSVSSKCGSADLLGELGVNTQLQPSGIERCINEAGIGFLFAPVFHPAMKHAARARTELGVRTIFNMLGPLTNPAGVRRQVIGTFNLEVAEKLGSALSQLKTHRAFVVHNHEGMDEVGLGKATSVHEVQADAEINEYSLTAQDFGLPDVPLSLILGGTKEENARIAMKVLEGENGPHRSVVLANAALGIRVAGKSAGLREAVAMAMEAIDSGKALQSLNKLKEYTNRS